MFNPTQVVIDGFVDELHEMYKQTYGILEPSYPGVMSFVARLALENIANSDAACLPRYEPHDLGDDGRAGNFTGKTRQCWRRNPARMAPLHRFTVVP